MKCTKASYALVFLPDKLETMNTSEKQLKASICEFKIKAFKVKARILKPGEGNQVEARFLEAEHEILKAELEVMLLGAWLGIFKERVKKLCDNFFFSEEPT